jgi:hypothetical protein
VPARVLERTLANRGPDCIKGEAPTPRGNVVLFARRPRSKIRPGPNPTLARDPARSAMEGHVPKIDAIRPYTHDHAKHHAHANMQACIPRRGRGQLHHDILQRCMRKHNCTTVTNAGRAWQHSRRHATQRGGARTTLLEGGGVTEGDLPSSPHNKSHATPPSATRGKAHEHKQSGYTASNVHELGAARSLPEGLKAHHERTNLRTAKGFNLHGLGAARIIEAHHERTNMRHTVYHAVNVSVDC